MNPAFATSLASIIVAVVAAYGAFSSQKQVSKAARYSSRLDFERDAYERARKFDTETITRQDMELEELKREISLLRKENKQLRDRVKKLEATTFHLERDDLDERDDDAARERA